MRRWLGTAGDSLREMISGAANCAGDVPSLAGPAVTGQSRANTSQEWVHRSRPVECGGDSAKAFRLRSLGVCE